MARLEALAVRKTGVITGDVEHRAQLFGRDRHERFEGAGDDAQAFDQIGENLGDAR